MLPGHPWWSSVAKTPCSQCREPRFDPLSGNQIPHATIKTWCSQINTCINIFKKEKENHWAGLEGNAYNLQGTELKLESESSWKAELANSQETSSPSQSCPTAGIWLLEGLLPRSKTAGRPGVGVGLQAWRAGIPPLPLRRSSISSFKKTKHFSGCFWKPSGLSQFSKTVLGDYTPLFLTKKPSSFKLCSVGWTAQNSG